MFQQPYQNPMNTNIINPYNNRYLNPYSPQTPNNTIIWVQGIEGAKAYQIAPNSIVQLMDSETEGRFYIKSSDNVGMCNLRIFKYEEITNTPPTPNETASQIDLSQYVTKDELTKIIETLKEDKHGKQSVSVTKPLITE